MQLSPRYDADPLITMDGPLEDQAVTVVRQRRRMETMLAGFSDAQWNSPSRCTGWSNKDVVAHLVTVNSFWETSIRAGQAGEPTRILATFDPAAHPPLLIGAMASQSGAEVLAQFVVTNDGLAGAIAAIDGDGWNAVGESPAGHVSLRVVAHHALWDSWIHERDIALPLGLQPGIESDEIVACLRYVAAVNPALALRAGLTVPDELFVDAHSPTCQFVVTSADAVDVHASGFGQSVDAPKLQGSAIDLIEALSIRLPMPADAPSGWRAAVKGLAEVFDSPSV